MGGWWERLVRSVKVALDATRQKEVLQFLLAESEYLVNSRLSRPLTHASLDSFDEEQLTPNRFLVGSNVR